MNTFVCTIHFYSICKVMHVFAYMVYICICFCVFEAESVELHALREHQAILLHHDIIVHEVKGAGGRVCDNRVHANN